MNYKATSIMCYLLCIPMYFTFCYVIRVVIASCLFCINSDIRG